MLVKLTIIKDEYTAIRIDADIDVTSSESKTGLCYIPLDDLSLMYSPSIILPCVLIDGEWTTFLEHINICIPLNCLDHSEVKVDIPNIDIDSLFNTQAHVN